MEKGKKNWVFCDGYLPPAGDNPEFEGHEALMMTNLNNEKAKIELVFVFEDKDPIEGIFLELDGMRTISLRMDKLGDMGVEQYPISALNLALSFFRLIQFIPPVVPLKVNSASYPQGTLVASSQPQPISRSIIN